jgi:hypothetical protein
VERLSGLGSVFYTSCYMLQALEWLVIREWLEHTKSVYDIQPMAPLASTLCPPALFPAPYPEPKLAYLCPHVGCEAMWFAKLNVHWCQEHNNGVKDKAASTEAMAASGRLKQVYVQVVILHGDGPSNNCQPLPSHIVPEWQPFQASGHPNDTFPVHCDGSGSAFNPATTNSPPQQHIADTVNAEVLPLPAVIKELRMGGKLASLQEQVGSKQVDTLVHPVIHCPNYGPLLSSCLTSAHGGC